LADPFTPCLASETRLLPKFRADESSQNQGTSPSVTIGRWRKYSNAIVFDISSPYSGFHQDGRVSWQWGPVPWCEGKSSRDLFTSVEHVRDDLTRVKRGISFGAVAEDEALEEDDLKNGADDKGEVNENTRGRSSTGVGGRENEPGEDNPEANGDEQEGTLGN